jgi:putative flippase GtrA
MLQRALNHSGVRYLIVGVLSLGVDYGGLLLLYRGMDAPLAVATTVSFLIGLVFNFLLTKFWTFNSAATKHSVRQSVRQAAMVAVLVVCNIGVTNAVVVWLQHIHIGPEISKLLTTAMITLWNYILYKKVIFKHAVAVAESAYVPEEAVEVTSVKRP